ncbi:MAG: UDP-glucose 4-epimerase GalE [Bacillota bacterium]
MRVLVTGGAGYIGSHTCKELADAGYEPVILDNLTTGHRELARWGEFVQGDLADWLLLCRVMGDYDIAAVLHFAASSCVGESYQKPDLYFRNNVCGTLNLLNAMRELGVQWLVFSSTCATYGLPRSLPLREDHPQEPISPYGESKLMIERMLHWYGQSYGLKYVSLRYFNSAGADPAGQTGEWHEPETHLIPIVLDVVAGRRPFLQVYGTDYPTADGTAVRDYIHVTDLAQAHVQALRYLQDGGESTALNLGTGRGYSVLEIVKAVENVCGRLVAWQAAPRRPGDPPELVADPSLAGRVLGWQPRLSDLDNIIRTAWQWHRRLVSL